MCSKTCLLWSLCEAGHPSIQWIAVKPRLDFNCSTLYIINILVTTPTHTLTDFGNRPRRLYVIVNPVSGGGGTEKLWSKVQQMFTVGQIVTDVISKSHTMKKQYCTLLSTCAGYYGMCVINHQCIHSYPGFQFLMYSSCIVIK